MGCSVVLNQRGAVYRSAPNWLAKMLLAEITAVAHHLIHQPVRLSDGDSGLINEPALSRGPPLEVPFTSGGAQVRKVRALTPVGALGRHELCRAVFLPWAGQRAMWLMTRTIPVLRGSTLSTDQPADNS